MLFSIAFLFTWVIKQYAIKKSIIDIPNERSSHKTPTPRGGGLAIVLAFYIGLFWFQNYISSNLFLALFSSLPIVIVSLLDDIVTISSKSRLIVQSFSALLALYFLGGVSLIDFGLFQLVGWWVNLIAFVSILWLTNLYNFLDGIDGYAGSEALFIGIAMYLLFENPLGLVIAVSSFGFLLFNWQKASIFMGDVGSATLGFLFAVFCFSNTSGSNIYTWLILLSLFWFDATLTLVARIKNNEAITTPHKKHLYQRLTQSGWSHQKVVIYSIGFNFLMLLIMIYFNKHDYIFLFEIIVLLFISYLIEKRKSFYAT